MTLEERIKKDLDRVGIPRDYRLSVRGYSKRYNGLYSPRERHIVLYSLNEQGELLPYKELLVHATHEAVHHYQWYHTHYIRVKGVMHNEYFHNKLNDSLSILGLEEFKKKGVRIQHAKQSVKTL